MTLEKIYLSNFRNFSEKLLEFSPGITTIVGPNATGKTNILESIHLLATGKSFRAKIEEEMIGYEEEIARVKGLVTDSRGESLTLRDGDDKAKSTKLKNQNSIEQTKLEAVLTRGEVTVGENPEKVQKSAKKKLLVNGVSRRLLDFAGNLKTVVFSPQDMEIVTESPSVRRRFLDDVVSLVDREYRRASLSYSKGLRQRNRLLLRIREEGLPRSQLMFWDRLLIKNGNYISTAREELIFFINEQKPLKDHNFSLLYDKSAISESRLEQYKNEEVAAATTLVGPHRDDFVFRISSTGGTSRASSTDRDLARFGSRGEQRMGVLWLKLAELAFIEEKSEDKPVLLLDDIFSELDHEHRDIVMQAAKSQQTIITTADPHFVEGLTGIAEIKLV